MGGEESWRGDESSAETHIHSLSLSDGKGSAFDKGHGAVVVAQDPGTWPSCSYLASLLEPESGLRRGCSWLVLETQRLF